MTTLATAPIGAKGQITLPKKVRQLLHIRQPGELVGFLMDEHRRAVRLTRVDVVPADDPFTEEDYRKMDHLVKTSPRKTFASYDALLKDVHRLVKRR